MWALIAAGLALAAPPPRDELGRVRTAAGLAGPDWGIWGDLSLNAAQRVALRGGAALAFDGPATAYGLLELTAGPYWLQPFVAGGGALQAPPLDWSAPSLGWRVEAGGMVLIRWGAGLRLSAVTDGRALQALGGGYLEW